MHIALCKKKMPNFVSSTLVTYILFKAFPSFTRGGGLKAKWVQLVLQTGGLQSQDQLSQVREGGAGALRMPPGGETLGANQPAEPLV